MIRFNAFIEVLSLSGFYLSYLAVPGTRVGVGVGLAFTCPSPAGGAGGLLGSGGAGGQSTPLTIPNPITTISTLITIIFMFIS
jgi:hypothetical protein